jgi:hypothetical protein
MMQNLKLLEELLDDLVLEAVRKGVPKAHLACIYDVKNKTIPAIRNSTPTRRYKTGEKIE